uniref:Uncharacterized protein n=1 Tax=Glossina morsitans morsitans TaxID=37546 RepID=A0A1B0FQT2_GLOMM
MNKYKCECECEYEHDIILPFSCVKKGEKEEDGLLLSLIVLLFLLFFRIVTLEHQVLYFFSSVFLYRLLRLL